jgi:hypothetical protein
MIRIMQCISIMTYQERLILISSSKQVLLVSKTFQLMPSEEILQIDSFKIDFQTRIKELLLVKVQISLESS